MTREEIFAFVKEHILAYIPEIARGQHVVIQAVNRTSWEIVDKWSKDVNDTIDELGLKVDDPFADVTH